MNPFTVYLILEFCASLLFSAIFTVNMLYQVTVVELSPLQLVLVGTTLEATVFLFEIPTGVLADVKSRRLSIIIGYAVMGAGFVVEGSFPFFGTVLLAQVMWGFGYTFTSGATQAWVADELGQERAGEAYLRGAQAARVGALVAIPLSVALGSISVAIPIVVAGALMVLLAISLALIMTEEGFTPTPPQERTTWGMMLKTLRDARQMVRRQSAGALCLAVEGAQRRRPAQPAGAPQRTGGGVHRRGGPAAGDPGPHAQRRHAPERAPPNAAPAPRYSHHHSGKPQSAAQLPGRAKPAGRHQNRHSG